jgi:hypothetical protein
MPAKGWYFGSHPSGNGWGYSNDPMSPMITDKTTGPGGMAVGSDQTAPTLQQIINALQSHADQAVSTSGEAPVAAQPTSGPPADTAASVATSQMSPVGSDAGTSGGAAGASGGGADVSTPSGGGDAGAFRKGGRVRARPQPGDPDSDRDMYGRKDSRKGSKVQRHDEGGFRVRGVGR